MITTMKKCEPGVNGGWSPSGQAAALIGSLVIGLFSIPYMYFIDFNMLNGLVLITGIGWLGCQIDSVLGATLENRVSNKGHSKCLIDNLWNNFMFISVKLGILLIYTPQFLY